jgi:hypothetical protein
MRTVVSELRTPPCSHSKNPAHLRPTNSSVIDIGCHETIFPRFIRPSGLSPKRSDGAQARNVHNRPSRIVSARFVAFNNQANASFNAAGGVGLLRVGPGGINFGGIGTHDVNACKIIVDSIDTTFHVTQYYHSQLQRHSPPQHLRRHLPPHPFCTHPPVRKRMGHFVFSYICP